MKFIDVKVTFRLEMTDDAPDGISEEMQGVSWSELIRDGFTLQGGYESLDIARVVAGTRKLTFGSAEDARALKDAKLGVKSLRESVPPHPPGAKCEACDDTTAQDLETAKGGSNG